MPRDGEAETEVVRFGVWRFIAFVEKLWFVRLRPALRGLKFIPFKKEIV